jgi:tetratricopeptide (TPR) repeat protein
MKTDPVAQRPSRSTAWAAIDAGAGDGEHEIAIPRPIALHHRLPAIVWIELVRHALVIGRSDAARILTIAIKFWRVFTRRSMRRLAGSRIVRVGVSGGMTMARFFAWLLLLTAGMAAPAHAQWHEAGSRRFVVYAAGKPEIARRMAEKLERLDAAMRAMRAMPDTDPGPANRLRVFVVTGMADVERLAGRQNVAGYYRPRAGASMIVVPRRDNADEETDLSADQVLFHEYAHHFMYRNFSGTVPGWFTEGFAEFFAPTKFERDGSALVGTPPLYRASSILALRQMPLEQVLEPKPRRRTPEETNQFYGMGWLLVHYFTLEPERRLQLNAYLEAINSGKRSLDAARSAFGDLKLLDRALDRYKTAKLMAFRIPAQMIQPGPITLRAMTPGESALMDLHIVSTNGVNKKQAATLLPRIQRAVADHGKDAWAMTVLAEAEFDVGNFAASLAAAEKAVALDPKSRRGHQYVGMARTALARSAEKPEEKAALLKAARQAIAAGNRLDPDDPIPMLLMYSSYRDDSTRTPHPSVVEALHYAQRLAPEDIGVRWMSMSERLRAGDLEQAKLLIAPMAYNPHAPADNPAMKLLQLMEAGDLAGARLALAKDRDEAAGAEDGDEGASDKPGEPGKDKPAKP